MLCYLQNPLFYVEFISASCLCCFSYPSSGKFKPALSSVKRTHCEILVWQVSHRWCLTDTDGLLEWQDLRTSLKCKALMSEVADRHLCLEKGEASTNERERSRHREPLNLSVFCHCNQSFECFQAFSLSSLRGLHCIQL